MQSEQCKAKIWQMALPVVCVCAAVFLSTVVSSGSTWAIQQDDGEKPSITQMDYKCTFKGSAYTCKCTGVTDCLDMMESDYCKGGNPLGKDAVRKECNATDCTCSKGNTLGGPLGQSLAGDEELVGRALLIRNGAPESNWIPVNASAESADRQWLFADVNGDGKSDLVSVFVTNVLGSPQNQSDVYFATESGFTQFPTLVSIVDLTGSDPWLVGDFLGDGHDGLFAAFAGKWYLTRTGDNKWTHINSSGVGTKKLAIGDFNGDGISDLFSANGSSWKVSYGGGSPWANINSSKVKLPDLKFGDFDGDGKTDVFRSNGEIWQVSSGGSSSWKKINSSGVSAGSLRIADLNGDGRSDVVRIGGGLIRVSYGGTSKWATLVDGVPNGEIVFADFNGDGADDVFVFNEN